MNVLRHRTLFSQSGGHGVLSGEDVTGRPATLSSQHRQGLDQHLQEELTITLCVCVCV